MGSLHFSDSYTQAVQVVRVRESWTQRRRVAGTWQNQPKEQNWIWVVAGDLDAYNGATIREIGHLRWKIENNAFGESTQHWHLTHCSHHHPRAVVALLWIKIIALHAVSCLCHFARQTFRVGLATLNEIRKPLYRSWLCGQPILLCSR